MSGAEFIEVSPWISAPIDLQPQLQGPTRADVVIVGGGFTGLSTALELRARGVDAVIVERDHCGYGASGRNAGHLTPTIGKDFPSLVKAAGRDRAVAFARFADKAVRYTEQLMERLNIDCDYRPTGNIVAIPENVQRNLGITFAKVTQRGALNLIQGSSYFQPNRIKD